MGEDEGICLIQLYSTALLKERTGSTANVRKVDVFLFTFYYTLHTTLCCWKQYLLNRLEPEGSFQSVNCMDFQKV